MLVSRSRIFLICDFHIDALYFCQIAPDLILNRAKAIENNVLSNNGGLTAAYKSKIRTLYVNLKDKNNPGLRESVVSGSLPVVRFCAMTSQVSIEISQSINKDEFDLC